MRILRITFALLPLGAVLLVGCKDHGSDVVPVKQEPVPLVLKVEIEPASGEIGTAVVLRCPGFVSPAGEYQVQFPGADDIVVAKGTPDYAISTFVPFGARSGEISVSIGQHQGRTGVFLVNQSVDTAALSVTPFDISPPITAKDSSVVDFMGIRRAWRADQQGDTIHLHRGFSIGEGSYEYHIVLIDQRGSLLPRLAAVWTHVDTDYGVAWDDTNYVGVLKLQDYSKHGVISGRFFGKASTPKMLNGTVAVWVDLGQ